MKDLYSRTKGLYIPSFFCMKIDSLSFGDNMTDREISLYVHEYIHFIQSFTTIHGLERINSDFATLMNMVNWIRDNANSIIHVPLSDDILNDLTKNNRSITQLTWGETEDINEFRIIGVSIDNESPIKIDNLRNVESAMITYILPSGEEGFCTFGAREIYEGMAYIIEQHITKDYEKSPDFPYNTAYKVAEFLYPQLSWDYRNILVVCDKALMSSNPGCEFINIIEWLRSIEFQPSTPDDLYKILECWETFDIDKQVKWLDMFVGYVEQVRYNLHTLLKDSYFESFHNWVDIIFDYAIELRTNEPMFWLDIVDFGEIRQNTYFQAIQHFAGAPLVETLKHEYYFIDPEGCYDSTCLVFMKVFHQIYSLLVNGDVSCSLMPWCNDSRNDVIVDSTCYKCPWKHPERNGELCTFKGIWQHWGLNDAKINE